MRQSMTPLYSALLSALLLAILSFFVAIGCGHGPAESAHDPSSLWLYARRMLLLGCACVLPVLTGGPGVRTYGWQLSPRWAAAAVVIGVCMGFGNRGGFSPLSGAALLLAVYHAGATALYFRAYLISTLQQYLRSTWAPVVISALTYGLFYLSVWTTWAQPGAGKVTLVALFTAIGLLYGYCYIRAKSVLVVWIMHLLSVINYRLLLG